ncbi:hypothetical protein [Paenibacillus polymyxa]|uniref:hypothetical protein n=1 Tax=Paenibacillus polymyxa TaxID=1406 RepID=UPI00287F86AD|nr:hypothetical protein [Paenibacillus polymyxa]
MDPSLPIGGFTRFNGLEKLFRNGHLNSLQDLEHYMLDDLYPQFTTVDGMAVKSLYVAIQQNDESRPFTAILAQRCPSVWKMPSNYSILLMRKRTLLWSV